MRSLLILTVSFVVGAPVHAQARFAPERLFHASFAMILAHGEMIALPAQGDSGLVPLVGRLYWDPTACQVPAFPCRAPYFVVAENADGTEPPTVWVLGVAGLPGRVEWLPPTADMSHGSARLRVWFAVSGRDSAAAMRAYEKVDFAVGWDTTRVIARSTTMLPNRR